MQALSFRSGTLIALIALMTWGAKAQDGQIEIRTIDGLTLRGAIASVNSEGIVTVSGAEKGSAPLRRCHSIGFPRRRVIVPDARSGRLRFELANEDVVFGEVIESTFDDVRVDTSAFGQITIPLERLRRVVVLANAEEASSRLGADVPDDRDVLFLKSKDGVDHLIGEVSRLQKTAVVFSWGDKRESTFVYDKEGVVAVRLTGAEAPKPPAGVLVSVHAKDSSRLTGVLLRDEAGPLRLKSVIAGEAQLQEGEVTEIVVTNGDICWLSDLEPTKVEEVPYLEGGHLFGLHRDKGLEGGIVTIGDRAYPKALEVHTRCELTYDLAGGYATFATDLGIDGVTADRPQRGAVSFSIIVDGTPVVDRRIVRGGDAAARIEGVDVRGKKTLVLRADFADNHHFNGWAVFGGAMLTRP